MATLDYTKSRDAINELFYDRFRLFLQNGFPNDNPPKSPLVLTKRGSNTPYIPAVKWQNVETIDLNDNGVHWLRISAQDILNRQKSMTGGRQEMAGTHYTAKGLIKVALYFSRSSYEGEECDMLKYIIQRCFIQQNSCGVWFQNPVVIDLPPEENHFRADILAEYRYDSVVH